MNKIWDLSLIVGRFQGFHIGHSHLIETALSVSDRVLILIGSSQEHGTELNPYSVTSRQFQIKEVFPQDNVLIGCIPDLNEEKIVDEAWGNHVLSIAKQYTRKIPDVYTYGLQPENHNWFKASEYLRYETKHMTEIVVSRDKFNISGTMIRKFLLEDDFDKWMKFVSPKFISIISDYVQNFYWLQKY